MTNATGSENRREVNIYDAKTSFSQLVSRAEGGAEIIITRNGKPAAKLVPLRKTQTDRVPGVWRDQVRIEPDFDSFDERDWYSA